MEKLEIYTKGTKVWFRSQQIGYALATLKTVEVKNERVKMVCVSDGGDEFVYEQSVATVEKNTDDLPMLQNPPHLEQADDLTHLSHLHEAAVLNSVKQRYANRLIYTYSGLVLIAMNPFARLNIYSKDQMRQYAGRSRHELEPHLFAIAEEAYRKMVDFSENQSIIVSGESGAGKTQSAKFVMRYFATVDELFGSTSNLANRVSVTNGDGAAKIEEAVLSTNPIMEAFGNAKTTRNDNSSRFGKYIEILFAPKPVGSGVEITGARMRTYLLERSRLVFQPKSERNYHIFYQLCAGVPAAEREALGLGPWNTFAYTNQGGVGVVQEMDDAKEFMITQQALSLVGVSVTAQWEIFKICAALLHMGNIKIDNQGGKSSIADSDPSLIKATNLLGINLAEFKQWLTKRQIITRSEKIMKDCDAAQALVSRDSVAKYIYSKLFDWIVGIVNTKLEPPNVSKNVRFIGVLDIYGFEHFDKNSFEQFCINYANEKLQQEFTRHVFKLEQEEYVKEKISWSFIDFSDNGPCIELIENKLGILDLLDEESRLPSGTDDNLLTKYYNRFASPPNASPYFVKPKFAGKEFIIKHYALDVKYQIDGFIEKNKDTVSDEQLKVLGASQMHFLTEIVATSADEPRPSVGGGAASKKKPTLGGIFKNSLVKLMETLRETNPHFIRCIKPNQAKVAFEFEPENVLGQLIACGVLETIKISRAGYPSKQTFADFVDRYYFLVPSKEWKKPAKELTKMIAEKSIKGTNKFEIGLTKIFFRAGQLAYLEKLRSEAFINAIVLIQKNIRRWCAVTRYKRLQKSSVILQALWRGRVARKIVRAIRRNRAAQIIQRNWKGYIARKRFIRFRRAIVTLQRTWRKYIRRRDREKYVRIDAAVTIQRIYRGYRARKIAKKMLRRIILLQSLVRRRRCRLKYKIMKAEAKSVVGNLKQVNFKLESKIVELSMQLRSASKHSDEQNEKLNHLEGVVSALKERNTKLEHDSKSRFQALVEELQASKKLNEERLAERDAAAKEAEKAHQMIKKRDDQLAALHVEISSLKKHQIESNDVQLKKAAEDSDHNLAVLRKEVASLRQQMSKMVSGKYATDQQTERFLNNDSMRREPSITAPSIPLSFYESAAQVASWIGSGNLLGGPTSPSTQELNSSKLNAERAKEEQEIVQTAKLDKPLRMLADRDLDDEVIQGLIKSLRIPLPSSQKLSSRREIFFPAHLIGFLLSQMTHHKMITRIESFFESIFKSIQELTTSFEDDYISCFWLSNTYELLSILKMIREKASLTINGSEESPVVVLSVVKNNLELLQSLTYRGWLKELKKRLGTMAIPAVIEHQGLPGHICKQNEGSIWTSWTGTTSQQFSIDQLVHYLSKESKTMKCYFLEDSMALQIRTELLRFIGVSCFNHLLCRKNFGTWKRGIQILYNVNKLEDWCRTNGVEEASLHLQKLSQASRLFTLNKNSSSDLEAIYDICFLLNSSQIKKLLQLYNSSDFDSPASAEILQEVNKKSVTDRNEELLIDLDAMPEFIPPQPRKIEAIDRFIPKTVSLPCIQAIIANDALTDEIKGKHE